MAELKCFTLNESNNKILSLLDLEELHEKLWPATRHTFVRISTEFCFIFDVFNLSRISTTTGPTSTQSRPSVSFFNYNLQSGSISIRL